VSEASKGTPKPVGSDDPLRWARYYWEQSLDESPDAFLAMVSVMRLHQYTMQSLKVMLKRLRLNPRLYLFLMTLYLSDGGARLLSRLSDDLMVHPTTVTVLADQLEKRGLVVRTPHPSDRRAIYCELTTQGRNLALEASTLLDGVNFGLLGLSTTGSAKLLRDLEDVRHVIGDRQHRRERLAAR
jgi:DNA-binding MarR family transcriptional regulator